jgi:leucyl-tRNA synthetase
MVIKDGAKMSKSLGNTVSPDDMVAKYGADSARMYSLFAAPPDRDLDWQDAGIEGIYRFLGRVYRWVAQNPVKADGSTFDPQALGPEARKVQRKLHQTIKRVTDDFDGRWHFNTCVAALMELLNELYAAGAALQSAPQAFTADVQRKFVLMLHPFAPYLAHELWEMLGERSNLLKEPWPKYDPALAKEEEIEYVVQVNGKIRTRVSVAADTDPKTVEARAMADAKVQDAVAGKNIVKIVVVPGKLVNVVVK